MPLHVQGGSLQTAVGIKVKEGGVLVPAKNAYVFTDGRLVPIFSSDAPPAGVLSVNHTLVQAGQSVRVTCTATDDVGLKEVRFYRGAVLVGTKALTGTSDSAYVDVVLSSGLHSLTAVVVDQSDQTFTTEAVVVQAATASITLAAPPSPLYAGDRFTAEATATDIYGLIQYVEFFIGETSQGKDYSASSGKYTMSCSGQSVGSYTLWARAYDHQGLLIDEDSVAFSVSVRPYGVRNVWISETHDANKYYFTAHYDNYYPVSSFQWNFGDGSTSSSANPTHTYSSGGSKTVSLTVTDSAGYSDSNTRTVTVVMNRAPAIVSVTPPTTWYRGDEYQLVPRDISVGYSVTDEDGNLASSAIAFGGKNASGSISGSSKSGALGVSWIVSANTIHGNNTGTFTVTDTHGVQTQQTFVIKVNKAGPAGTISFQPSVTQVSRSSGSVLVVGYAISTGPAVTFARIEGSSNKSSWSFYTETDTAGYVYYTFDPPSHTPLGPYYFRLRVRDETGIFQEVDRKSIEIIA